MVSTIQQYWWVFLILWIASKISRHAETRKKKSNTSDAENLVLNVVRAVDSNIGDPRVLDKILNDSVEGLGDNVYKRALVDGIIHQLEKGEVKAFEPVKGSHPLQQLARRAVESEKKKNKIIRGLKKGVVVGLKILKGGLI